MRELLSVFVVVGVMVMLLVGCGSDAVSSDPAGSRTVVSTAVVETETTGTVATEVAEDFTGEALENAILGTWKFSNVAVDGSPRMTLEEYLEVESIDEESDTYKEGTLCRYVFATDGVFYLVGYEDGIDVYECGYWEVRGDTVYVGVDQSTIDTPDFTATLNQGVLEVISGEDTLWMEKESDSQMPPESATIIP